MDKLQVDATVLVGIGANLPTPDGTDAIDTCLQAAAALDGVAGLSLQAVSRLFQTEPVPPSDQPLYVNAVVLLRGHADPAALLAALQAIENTFGRVRSVPNAPRTLDLDILAMGGLVRLYPDPMLPHPRMHQRAFVLAPLLDVAPNWRHPISALSARDLLGALSDQGVVALASKPAEA